MISKRLRCANTKLYVNREEGFRTSLKDEYVTDCSWYRWRIVFLRDGNMISKVDAKTFVGGHYPYCYFDKSDKRTIYNHDIMSKSGPSY
jgi:hypothetical protein